MAAVSGYEIAQRVAYETNETRRLENRQEGRGQTASGVDSGRVRVHYYERGFRRKPDTRAPADEGRADLTHGAGGALGSVMDGAQFRRTTATCNRGVSDPLRTGRGAKKGAAKWGSLTPRLPRRSTATAARRAMPAAQNAAGARPEVARLART